MIDEPENLVLKHLTEIRADLKLLKDGQARVEDMVRGLTSIMAHVLGQLEGIRDRLSRLERERES